MSASTVQVRGFRELSNAFKRAADETLSVQLRDAGKESGALVAEAMRAKAPTGSGRDPHPGRMRDTVRIVASPRGITVKVGGPKAPYTGAIVGGWPKHHIAKNHFPFEALDEQHSAVVAKYEQSITKLIEAI
ncbi:MAG TPA: hypothetical protein VGQ42_15615 [Candidatus Dormibacteraeota bacterium]|nr:hypothetical protein [Candidatus Dormibacteraeota bacterium]